MTPRVLTVFATTTVATAGDLRAAGVTAYEIRRLVAADELTQIAHGVYVQTSVLGTLPERSAQRHALTVAAYLRANPGLVASHESAARLHGLCVLSAPGAPDRGPSFTRPPRGSRSSPRTARVYLARLPREHVTNRFGVPVTTVTRTVADIARQATFIEAVVTADSALHLRQTSKSRVEAVLAQCQRWPGVRQAREVMAFSNGLSESVLESAARVVFADRGLPPPRIQAEVYTTTAFVARVDFMWREHQTVAESDGALKYDGRDDARAELRRDRRLRDAGFEVVHFTWYELFFEAELVEARIRAAFRRAQIIGRRGATVQTP